MSAYTDSVNKAVTMMVDFIHSVAHTEKFDDMGEVKNAAAELLDTIEKDYVDQCGCPLRHD